MIEADQYRRFDRTGYLIVEDFVEPEACRALRARALELVAERSADDARFDHSVQAQLRDSTDYFLDSSEDIRLFYEEDAFDESGELHQPVELSINKLGHAMHDLDPVFDRFSRTTALADLAGGIGLDDPVLIQSMYIFKQPRIGGEFVAHCDHTYLWTEPATVTGFWFALEDATMANGCLAVLPGGHRLPVRERFRVDPSAGAGFEDLGAPHYPIDGFVPLEVPAGSLIVLDGRLPHRSGANRSGRSRHAYALHAISRSADYPGDNWLQRRSLPLRGFH